VEILNWLDDLSRYLLAGPCPARSVRSRTTRSTAVGVIGAGIESVLRTRPRLGVEAGQQLVTARPETPRRRHDLGHGTLLEPNSDDHQSGLPHSGS
jgi:hypothetical protein